MRRTTRLAAGEHGDAEDGSPAASSADSAQQMLPPVIVEPGQTEATAKVGDFIDILVDQLAGTTLDTSTPELLEISQGGEKDGAEFNPGAKALAPGNAVITVTLPDATSYDLNITITE